MPHGERASHLRSRHATPGHDVHGADQDRPLFGVVVDKRLDVLRIQDVRVGHVARVDVVHDLEVSRLQGLVTGGDGGCEIRVPGDRCLRIRDQLGRRRKLSRGRLPGGQGGPVIVPGSSRGRARELDRRGPTGDVA